MSVYLLRRTTLNRTICFAAHTFRPHRFYTEMALTNALVDHSTPLRNHEQDDSAAGPTAPHEFQAKRFPNSKKGKSQDSSGTPKSRRANKPCKTSTPRKDPLAATGLELYLDEIREAGLEPTLPDLERCRPERYTNHVDSPQYAEEYHSLVDKLCRSFSRQQLRQFTIQLKLHSRAALTKHEFAESIIEKQWNWPSLKEVQKRHRDRTEVSVKTFPVNPMELFLMLGKDGAELLQMSKDYNVHIAVTRPLALRVEGLRGSLRALSDHIAALKNAIVEETFELPGGKPINQDLVQPISRLANAYVENFGDKGMVRICAKLGRDLDLAKRLVTRACFESAESLRTPLISYLPIGVASATTIPRVVFPYTYSVYPFLSPRSLPWTMKGGGAFRIRRVIEWLTAHNHEDIQATGGLAEGKGQILSIDNKELTLEDTLFGGLPEHHDNTASSRIVTASFGHLLLPSATSSQRASIIPPLKGYWSFAKILAWMEQSCTDTTFVPSLPTQLLNSAPKQQKFLLRFFYRAQSEFMALSEGHQYLTRSQPTKMIKFEVVLDHSRPAEKVSPSDPPVEVQSQSKPETEPELEHIADNVVSLGNSTEMAEDPRSDIYAGELPHVDGFMQSFTQSNTSSDTRENDVAEIQTPKEFTVFPRIGPEFSTQPRCWAGIETTANLILPDRPMDIRFTAFDHVALAPGQEPEELQSYSYALRSFLHGRDVDGDPTAPIPPNTVMHNGETYVLHKSSSIRQSDEVISGLAVDLSNSAGASPQVISESILDLESQQKSTVCQVSCIDHASDDSWKAFLGHCDRLSSAPYAMVGDEDADGKKDGKKLGLDID